MIKKQAVTVSEYLTSLMDLSNKTQKQIGDEIGYTNPNMVTMLKQGRSKLPISKVTPMAVALGVDPLHLLRIVLQEYQPEMFESLKGVIGQSLISKEEEVLVGYIRKATEGIDFQDPDLVKQAGKAIEDALRPLAAATRTSRAKRAEATRNATGATRSPYVQKKTA